MAKALIGAVGMTVLTPAIARPQEQPSDNAVRVVESFVGEFNRHDVAGMIALVTTDIELYYADADGVFGLASASAGQLAEDMRRYFEERPQVRSVIDGIIPGPRFVSFREQIVGGQSSVAVYEVPEGLVRRVWYFPAETTPAGGPGPG